ncbi:MAG: hypothetical protein ACKO19_02930 [Betaproteobacteria bacterium]
MQIIIKFNTDLSEEADGQQLRRIVQRRLFAFKSKIKLTQINLETPPKPLVSARFQASCLIVTYSDHELGPFLAFGDAAERVVLDSLEATLNELGWQFFNI